MAPQVAEQLTQWENEIRSITQRFKDHFQELSAGDLNWQPNSGSWSIAQNLEHVIHLNLSYLPVIQSLRKGTLRPGATARVPFLVRFFSKSIKKFSSPETRNKKTKTFSIWQPSAGHVRPDILAYFEEEQENLISRIWDNYDFIAEGHIIHSPASKYIVYPIDQAFQLMIDHEKRHLQQCLEVKKLLPQRATISSF